MQKKQMIMGVLATLFVFGSVGCSTSQDNQPNQHNQHKNHNQESMKQGQKHENGQMNKMKPYKPTATIGHSVEPFSYTNQDKKAFSSDKLKGKVWIADFMFTRCVHVCPKTIPNKIKLQKMIKDENLDVQIISFSVDPEYDTPEKMKKYAEEHKVDTSIATLLSGYDFSTIQRFAKQSFNLDIHKKDGGVAHGSSFYLIDQNGKIVKEYNGIEPDLEQMDKDMKEAVKKK